MLFGQGRKRESREQAIIKSGQNRKTKAINNALLYFHFETSLISNTQEAIYFQF